MPYKYFPIEFSSYEDYVKYLKKKGFAIEDKQLLLKDLCARLPYDVMVDYESNICILNEIDPACKDIDYITVRIQDVERLMCAKSVMIENIKPYLRPMSSMTEEERKEFTKLFCKWHDDELFDYIEEGTEFSIWKHKGISPVVFDWLNAHHFDYRGLLEKGLAIAVTEENNPYKG